MTSKVSESLWRNDLNIILVTVRLVWLENLFHVALGTFICSNTSTGKSQRYINETGISKRETLGSRSSPGSTAFLLYIDTHIEGGQWFCVLFTLSLLCSLFGEGMGSRNASNNRDKNLDKICPDRMFFPLLAITQLVWDILQADSQATRSAANVAPFVEEGELEYQLFLAQTNAHLLEWVPPSPLISSCHVYRTVSFGFMVCGEIWAIWIWTGMVESARRWWISILTVLAVSNSVSTLTLRSRLRGTTFRRVIESQKDRTSLVYSTKGRPQISPPSLAYFFSDSIRHFAVTWREVRSSILADLYVDIIRLYLFCCSS